MWGAGGGGVVENWGKFDGNMISEFVPDYRLSRDEYIIDNLVVIE